MASKHIVKQGECIESIALEHGFFWETIWNHAGNRELRKQRANGNVLRPGDEVHIPDRRTKSLPIETGQRHRFVLKGVPSKLRIIVRVDDEPRPNAPYVLEVDGKRYEGTADGQGRIAHPISPRATRGKLFVGEGNEQQEITLALGHLDPIEELSGVQARLNNLGFFCGEVDGETDPLTEQAIMDFQAHHGLEPSGELDDATRGKLLELHGC